MISLQKLIEISHNSRTLSECINQGIKGVEPQNQKPVIHQRLDHWCQVVAQGDWEKLKKRLDWDNLNIEQVQNLIENESLPSEQSLPYWTGILPLLAETAINFRRERMAEQILAMPIDSDDPLPFEDVFLPVIIVARQKLSDRLSVTSLSPDRFPLTMLSPIAYRTLERMLLKRLVTLSARTLYAEFSQFRPPSYNGINLLLEQLNLSAQLGLNSTERKYYDSFVEKLWRDGFSTYWQNYPVLARLIATTLLFWVEATAEFIERFQSDRLEISNRLAKENNYQEMENNFSGKIAQIQGSLSDFHNRGRAVLILTLESGQKLVYKPQNLELEEAYNQLLDWCNRHSCPLPFKVLQHYNRENYGWVLDYVEQQPCADRSAANRFYQRGGMLLCLLYVLGANDCHYENLIAHGEHLVLIDLETLMHPQAEAIEGSPQAIQEMLAGDRQLWDSVLRTGLLPRWDFSPDNSIAYDISGLGSVEFQESPWPLNQWNLINTDEMYLTRTHQKLRLQANIPHLDGVALSPQDHLENLIDGFTQMYRFLVEERQDLLAAQELQAVLPSQTVRFIFRATHVYQALLEKTLAPDYLKNGIDRSIELDILSRTFLNAQQCPLSWPILAAELAALEQLDIPYFGTTAGSNALTMGIEQPLEEYLHPSYDRFIERLQSLDEQDLAWQVGLIRGSFSARFTPSALQKSGYTPHPSPPLGKGRARVGWGIYSQHLENWDKPLSSSQLIEAARQIAVDIKAAGVEDGEGNIHWMGLSYVDQADRFQFQPLGYNFYDGNCGIALFLTAFDRIARDSQFRSLAIQSLQPLRKLLRNPNPAIPQQLARQMGIGGATGLGSIIYALVKIAQFSEDGTWLEDASRAANLLTSETIASDRQLDIIGGAAGALLGLLSLYQQTGETIILQRAIACGQTLISQRIAVEGQPMAWQTIAPIPLTGFSHGAAGIAYALLRLYEVTQEQQYLAVAREGIAYETAVFSPRAQNWPDFLTMPPSFQVRWCHGASGIGLARLGGLCIDPSPDRLQEIEVALETTQKYTQQSVDHLCCGHFGRLELLAKAGQVLARPQLSDLAARKATHLVQQAQKSGGYYLFGKGSGMAFHPGFFQGTAGIGYQLLRLAHPELLPVVLLWE